MDLPARITNHRAASSVRAINRKVDSSARAISRRAASSGKEEAMASATDRAGLYPAQEPPDFRLPSGLQRDSFPAMGTTVSLLVPARAGRRAGALVRALFWEWERTLSRFLEHSELSALNRQAGVTVT